MRSGKVSANVNPENNLLKWIGPSHGPVPLKFAEKLFFNKGLISGLILLGKAWTLNFSIVFVKGCSVFSWLQDQLWKSLLQMWTRRTNLLKWTGPFHGPVPWKFVEKLFFNKGLISGLILLGQGDKQDFFPEKMVMFFFAQTCFLTKKMVCQDFLPQWWTFQTLLGDWICCFFFHNSEPRLIRIQHYIEYYIYIANCVCMCVYIYIWCI